MFIIEKPSAVYYLNNCVLGQGKTEKEAWEDAYGPKPWSTYTKKSARGAWAKQVNEEDYLNEVRVYQ